MGSHQHADGSAPCLWYHRPVCYERMATKMCLAEYPTLAATETACSSGGRRERRFGHTAHITDDGDTVSYQSLGNGKIRDAQQLRTSTKALCLEECTLVPTCLSVSYLSGQGLCRISQNNISAVPEGLTNNSNWLAFEKVAIRATATAAANDGLPDSGRETCQHCKRAYTFFIGDKCSTCEKDSSSATCDLCRSLGASASNSTTAPQQCVDKFASGSAGRIRAPNILNVYNQKTGPEESRSDEACRAKCLSSHACSGYSWRVNQCHLAKRESDIIPLVCACPQCLRSRTCALLCLLLFLELCPR